MRISIGQASLHNKYCVQKARWEDHLRNIKEEEEIIINAYRQYKVGIYIFIFGYYVKYFLICQNRWKDFPTKEVAT